jgi:hypothetical protein
LRRIRITVIIRVVILQTVRISGHGNWLGLFSVWFLKKNDILYSCLNFSGSEFHAGTLLTANVLPPSVL